MYVCSQMQAKSSQKKAIVIGAGVAGSAASIRLAKSGYHVQLIESNDQVGGNIGDAAKLKRHPTSGAPSPHSRNTSANFFYSGTKTLMITSVFCR